MRIRFNNCVLASRKHFKYLDAIIARVEVGAHEWHVEDPDVIEESDWLAGAREFCWEVFEKAAKVASYPSSGEIHRRLITVAVSPEEGELTPEKASRYLSKPLKIIVENKFTDGAFLNCILHFLAPKKLKTMYIDNKVPDLIEIDGAGGLGEIPKHVIDRAEAAKQEGLPVRIVVFTDSESRYAGYQDSQVASVEAVCQDHGIPYRILKKRSIENYIPNETLSAWANDHRNHRHTVNALIDIPTTIRDYFPIKKGMQSISSNEAEVNFYSPIQEPHRSALRNGLGDIAIACFSNYMASLSADALRQRDHDGDLNDLVQIIVTEL